MSEQHTNPEGTTQLPPEVQEFQTTAMHMRSDFTFEHSIGIRTEEGIIDYDSLGVALKNISKAAIEDPAVLSLIQAANESNRAVVETSEPQPYREVAERPEFELLKLFGAVRKVDRQQFAPTTPEVKTVDSERAKRFGHQILVDGHLIQGLIGSRPNEVVTKQGILRTRDTPRRSV